MLPTRNFSEVQNGRTLNYGYLFPYYSHMQSLRYDLHGSEISSLMHSDGETSPLMHPDTKTSFSFWNTFTNANQTSYELATMQSFSIDVAGIQQELVKTCGVQDTESVRQDFIRNGIESAINGKSTLHARQPPGSRISAPGRPKNPLSSLDNQSVWPSSVDSAQTLPLVDNVQKRSNRCKRNQKENEDYCVFCFNNGEDQETYTSHACRDEKGHVMCPRLQRYVCPYCRATGFYAHTKKYCPQKPIITPADLEKMVFNGSIDQRFASAKGSAAAGNRGGRRALRF